jgi:predicted DNA-binding transcriptional regulator AlpA
MVQVATPKQRLLRLAGVLDKVGLSRSFWLAKVKAGEAPAPVRLFPNVVVWPEVEIDDWIEKRLEEARRVDQCHSASPAEAPSGPRGGRPRKGASVTSISNA